MDVDIMPGSTTLVSELEKQIIAYFSGLLFRLDHTFYWSAVRQEVHYEPAKDIEDIWQLLHEIAHAELKHNDYIKDIQLLRQEAAAWHYAQTKIAVLFNIAINEDFAEDQLDSYREWLHKRSCCPTCTHTGIQQTTSVYQCINCSCSWSVNDARQCGLRRIKLQDQSHFGQQVFAE